MKQISKFQDLGYLLGQFGDSKIGHAEFFARMNERGYTQDDIDAWCAEDRERDNAVINSRTKGSATASAARGTGRFEQEEDRQERGLHIEGQEDIGEGDQEAERAWPLEQIWYTLSPAQIKWIDDIAYKRFLIAEAVPEVDHEGRDRETRWKHKRNGYRAEAVARLFFGRNSGIRWTIHDDIIVFGPKIDFSDFIDVKFRRKKDHDLSVNRRTFHKDRAYLFVCGAMHPHYRIIGWFYGHELKAHGTKTQHDPKREPRWSMKMDHPMVKNPYDLRRMALAKVLK